MVSVLCFATLLAQPFIDFGVDIPDILWSCKLHPFGPRRRKYLYDACIQAEDGESGDDGGRPPFAETSLESDDCRDRRSCGIGTLFCDFVYPAHDLVWFAVFLLL